MPQAALFEALLNLVYPPHCVACDAAGAWLCETCIAEIPYLQPPLCARCGRPSAQESLCSVCSHEPSHLTSLRSLSPHRWPLRRAVHALKYQGLRALAEPLGDLLADYWPTQQVAIDLIVPVPLHRSRVRMRGYNQSELLASALGQRLGLCVSTGTLIRTRNTPAQVGLDHIARWDNVWGAFQCQAESLGGLGILLVDDVLTTGATLEACAAPLLEAGVAQVHALTLTRALGDP